VSNQCEFRPEDWGPLAARYQDDQPRTILALDGGGIRGLITLGVLRRIESLLQEQLGVGDDFRLCDFFDYIGGTSTGAIISAGLARGMSIAEIEEFYQAFAQKVFKARFNRFTAKFDARRLEELLHTTFRNKDNSDADLRPINLNCLLLAVTRNASTDSAWPISSNPAAKYNDPRRSDCNLRIPLWQIVRASSAAPTFFDPSVIQLDPRDPRSKAVFVDGATTAYNNPGLLMYRMATMNAYNLCWKTGVEKLLLVSVGTGTAPAPRQDPNSPNFHLLANAKAVVSSLLHQATIDQDIMCRLLGRCCWGQELDSEIGNLVNTGNNFLYSRYNAELTARGLDALGLDHIRAETITPIDSLKGMASLTEIGQTVAKHVDEAHFGPFLQSKAEAVKRNMELRKSREFGVL